MGCGGCGVIELARDPGLGARGRFNTALPRPVEAGMPAAIAAGAGSGREPQKPKPR